MPLTTQQNVEFFGRPSTSIVHRPFPGFRRVTDRASRVAVSAFPMVMSAQLSAMGMLPSAGAYILANDHVAYFGESVRLPRRLAEHSVDSAKAHFARDVFLISSSDSSAAYDKNLVMDLQFRLSKKAVDASLVTVSSGVGPMEIDLAEADRATHDVLFSDALRLLHDAGCWFLQPVAASETGMRDASGADDAGDSADAGPIIVGVSTTPLGSEEFELTYDGIWARGYWAEERFVVAAGSELRSHTNTSCNSITCERRDDLLRAGILERIPGLEDRRRLVVAVAFPSTSIAAKSLCGAHTTPRWIPIAKSRVVVLEGLRGDAASQPSTRRDETVERAKMESRQL